MEYAAKVRTCLWLKAEAEEAARLYTSLIDGSELQTVYRPEPAGPVLVCEFTIGGTPYMTMNHNDDPQFTYAASISVLTKDQAETDRYWDALTADGGAPGRCGWLKDRFGVSWQIVPEDMPRLLNGPDPEGRKRATDAMMGMSKIDVAAMKAAYDGTA